MSEPLEDARLVVGMLAAEFRRDRNGQSQMAAALDRDPERFANALVFLAQVGLDTLCEDRGRPLDHVVEDVIAALLAARDSASSDETFTREEWDNAARAARLVEAVQLHGELAAREVEPREGERGAAWVSGWYLLVIGLIEGLAKLHGMTMEEEAQRFALNFSRRIEECERCRRGERSS